MRLILLLYRHFGEWNDNFKEGVRERLIAPRLFPFIPRYFPANNLRTSAANPTIPCSRQSDLAFPLRPASGRGRWVLSLFQRRPGRLLLLPSRFRNSVLKNLKFALGREGGNREGMTRRFDGAFDLQQIIWYVFYRFPKSEKEISQISRLLDIAKKSMIPEFNVDGNLPEGIHSVSEKEFLDLFTTSSARRKWLG